MEKDKDIVFLEEEIKKLNIDPSSVIISTAITIIIEFGSKYVQEIDEEHYQKKLENRNKIAEQNGIPLLDIEKRMEIIKVAKIFASVKSMTLMVYIKKNLPLQGV